MNSRWLALHTLTMHGRLLSLLHIHERLLFTLSNFVDFLCHIYSIIFQDTYPIEAITNFKMHKILPFMHRLYSMGWIAIYLSIVVDFAYTYKRQNMKFMVYYVAY